MHNDFMQTAFSIKSFSSLYICLYRFIIRHEGLNIYIYANPKNQRERDFNATMSEKAEAIRCRRFEAIVNERYDFFDKRKYKTDFLEYYRKQLPKHDQKWEFVYQHFYNPNMANVLSKKLMRS